MSRGDEIEEGAPKPRWRDDNDEPDEPRDREKRVRIDKPNRSGAVTAVGIVAIILGSLNLVCGVCGGFGGVCLTGFTPFFQDFMKQAAANDPNIAKDPNVAKAVKDLDKAGPAGGLAIGEGIFNVLRGTGLLVSGIFILRRSNWARYLTLAMAAIGLLGTCADVGIAAALGLLEMNSGIGAGVGLVFGIAFAVFAFLVLLNPKNAKEFAS
jgi:hypothetical protein